MSIDTLLGTSKTRYDMLEEGYMLANKEIGYRTEDIGK
ncbi:Uncharacterised protein [[Clostridium] sordellii]|nr:Uncharacterised protein [[Clostridium] sordellii] [Paeniclostridium sordellii]